MSNLNLVDRLKYEFKTGGNLKILIFINVLVFVFFAVLEIFTTLFKVPGVYGFIREQAALPGTLFEIVLQPWSLITSLFVHADFFHIAFNMLWLFFIGQLFLQYFSQRKLLLTYILGGIAGSLLHVLSYDIFPYLQMRDPKGLIGASGAVEAFFGAMLFYRPTIKVQLFFGISIPFWVLALFFILSDFSALTRLDGVAHFAHIGGFLFGLVSMINVNQSNQFMNRIERWFFNVDFTRIFKRKPRMKVYRNEDFRKMNDDQYRDAKASEQEKVNAILDKISKGGYDSLSKTEKAFLFKFGNDKRS
jgi:membrane associated rhomboid family serine protease